MNHISLTTRSGAGAALSQAQFDANITTLQAAVNGLMDLVGLVVSDSGVYRQSALSELLYKYEQTLSNTITSTGAAHVTLCSFELDNVPAGDTLFWYKTQGVGNAGANNGHLTLQVAGANLDVTPTDPLNTLGNAYGLTCMGRFGNFAGGTLSLSMFFDTSSTTSNVSFSNQHLMVIGGL
jgi:hypothetical protein